tara:strand:- start:305 stop:1150 length:846 start_codon:yes stop_codon:yes gene_type:complete
MLPKFKIIILFITSIFLLGCNQKVEKTSQIKETDIKLQMIESYNEGVNQLKKGDVLFAVKKFNEVELLLPQSEWASKSILMSAYAYYSQDYYNDAIFELNRFLKLYSKHKDIPYANFLLAMCYYEQIVDEKKDLFSITESKKIFQYIVREYPETDFALDAKFKLLLIDNILASKEMYVARYYMDKKKWIPAINRFKKVVQEYDKTIYIEEALHRLVEIYYVIGLTGESEKYATTLGYNYQSSAWYAESYKIFNQKYKNNIDTIRKEKKINLITEKIKSLVK